MHKLLQIMQILFVVAALGSVATLLYCLICDPVLPIFLRKILSRRHFFTLPRWGRAFEGRGGASVADSLYRASAWALGLGGDSAEGAGHSWPSPMERRLGRLAKVGRLSGKILAFIGWSHFVFIAITGLLVFCYKWIDPPVTVLMAYRRFENGYTIARPEPLRIPEDITKRRRDMLIRVEDRGFFKHDGFDFGAIKYAYGLNKKWGEPISGASTLSMQTARTLFLIPVKNYFRKYLEAIVTVELEAIVGKERILELYFSTAEWGRGVFGIQAASRRYYGRKVSGISDERYIRLLSLLPSPVRFNPDTLFNHRSLGWRYDYLMNLYLPKPAETTPPTEEWAAGQDETATAPPTDEPASNNGTPAPAP